MFDFVAKHKRLLQLVLVVLIIPPFAFWGIESYQSAFSSAADVAEVDGQKITEQEFNEQLRQQQERMRGLLGRNYQAAMFDSPELRSELLEGMISQRLMMARAVGSKLAVTDEQLRGVIGSIPAFQDDGKFSKARYDETLRREGYSPAVFESGIKRDLIAQQVVSAVGDAGIASRVAARQLAVQRAERREVSQLALGADAFTSQVKVTPEMVRSYDEANRASFEVPESAKIEYVVLNSDALLALEPVSAEEVKNWYQSSIERYQEKEQRRASHILIAVKADASGADRTRARERAQSLVAQAQQAPGRFADLAQKNSDDPGSGARGGDLGYFSRGMMVRPFEDAVFGMKMNEVTGPVESEFGFHVIRLTGIKSGKTRPLEEVRPEIEAELRKQRAGRKFAEAAEAFSNLVYEQPDSLKPVAERYRLQIQTSDWVTRRAAANPLLNNPKLLTAVFGDESLKSRRNTEAIEVAPGTLVAARVIEHKPATTRPLEEVRGEIVKQLTRAEAAQLAQKQGEERLDALKNGNTTGAPFGPARLVSRGDPQGIRAEAIAAIFRAGRERLPVYVGLAVPSGYAIYRIGRVVAGEADDASQKNVQVELGRIEGTREFQAYLASLRASAKVQINKALLEKKQQ